MAVTNSTRLLGSEGYRVLARTATSYRVKAVRLASVKAMNFSFSTSSPAEAATRKSSTML